MSRWFSNNPWGICLVNRYQYSPDFINKSSAEDLLNDARQDITNISKGKILREETFTLDGVPGKTYRYQGPTKAFGEIHFLVDKPFLYEFGCLCHTEADLDAPSVTSYHKSFHLKK
jgi:hypothetical protein